MGDKAVYRKQFYTKLVSSCHFMLLYLYICSFFFVLLTRESKKKNKCSCLVLAEAVVTPSPTTAAAVAATMWFQYDCQKGVSAARWSKVTERPGVTRGGFGPWRFRPVGVARHGDGIRCSTDSCVGSENGPALSGAAVTRSFCRDARSSNTCSAFKGSPIFSPSLFFSPLSIKQELWRQTLLSSRSLNPRSSQMKFSVRSRVLVCRLSRLLCLLTQNQLYLVKMEFML